MLEASGLVLLASSEFQKRTPAVATWVRPFLTGSVPRKNQADSVALVSGGLFGAGFFQGYLLILRDIDRLPDFGPLFGTQNGAKLYKSGTCLKLTTVSIAMACTETPKKIALKGQIQKANAEGACNHGIDNSLPAEWYGICNFPAGRGATILRKRLCCHS
jgi:hypothetical protein